MAEYDKGRYYWIKLTDRFLESDTVDFLMSQKDGANYVVLYQMLCLKTVNNNGVLARKLGEILIPYDIDKITRDCKFFSIDTVRIALELYKRLGLVYEQDDGILRITDFDRLVGSQTYGAEKKQLQLQNRGGNKGGTKVEKIPPYIDIEKDKEKEIEIDKKNIHTGQAMNAFCEKYGIEIDNYNACFIEQIDWNLLDSLYSQMTHSLTVEPYCYHLKRLSWITKPENYKKIIGKTYIDKPKKQTNKADDKPTIEEMAEKIGVSLDEINMARRNGWTELQIEQNLISKATLKGVKL